MTEDGMSDNGESGASKLTEIKKAALKLKRENARLMRKLQSLELVFRNSVDILVVVDAQDGTIKRVSDAVENVLGYNRKELIGQELTTILPGEDESPQLHMEGNIPEILDGVFLDQKILCSNGSIKTMDMTTILVETDGFSSILLTFRDTSERRRFQREMIKKNSALDSALSAMIIVDSSWRIDYGNLQALEYWRYNRGEIIQQELSDLFSYVGAFEEIKKSLEENGSWEDTIECIRMDSTTFTAHATAVAVESEEDIESCYVLSFLDITDRVRLEKQLTELSLHDELTGLFNRRGFMTLGRQLLDSARRKQPEVGLLYVDIDYLKLINDELGHDAGDEAIMTTSRILRNCFRESDIIARLGGDEFVILFLDTSGFTVHSIRDRIETKIQELVEESPLPFMLSLSIGYHSTVLCYQTQIGRLLSGADALMFEDKETRHRLITDKDILKKDS